MQLPDFVIIQSQAFLMGTPEQELSLLAKIYGGTRESYREESPQHSLTLPAFAIARTAVTNAQYAEYIAAMGLAAPLHWHSTQPPDHTREHPVVNVSWYAARAFCAWLTQNIGGQGAWNLTALRLPSEAEWELAARGTNGRRFPWGEEWHTDYANTRESSLGWTQAVGSYPSGRSPSGCLDMAGNVWEWTTSLDRPYPYNASDGREDQEAPGRRILRGGCYANPHGYARCACRFRLNPTVVNDFLGFRLAASLMISDRDTAAVFLTRSGEAEKAIE